MHTFIKLVMAIAFMGLSYARAQDKTQRFSDGPKDLRKYLTILKHRNDSIAQRSAEQARLRSFYASTIYQLKRGSVLIFMAETHDTIINRCTRESMMPQPFVKFITERTLDFFGVSRYLPRLKK